MWLRGERNDEHVGLFRLFMPLVVIYHDRRYKEPIRVPMKVHAGILVFAGVTSSFFCCRHTDDDERERSNRA